MNEDLNIKINKLMNNTKAIFLESKYLYKGDFISLIQETYLLPNNIVMTRERIIKNNNKQAVIIIAITKENNYLLVSQNRINKMTTLEFPSGYVEINESIKEATIRELLEETGYTTDEIKLIDSYNSQIGIDSSIVNIVIAYNCIKITNQNLGKYEYINFAEFSFDELQELIDLNYISGVGNKLAFYELLNINQNKKKLKKFVLPNVSGNLKFDK